MRLPEPTVLRRKDNWPRGADAASPHNTEKRDHSEDPHAPYPTSLRAGPCSSVVLLRCLVLGLVLSVGAAPLKKKLVCCFWSSNFVAHVLPFVDITCTYERWVARRIRELRVTFGDCQGV